MIKHIKEEIIEFYDLFKEQSKLMKLFAVVCLIITYYLIGSGFYVITHSAVRDITNKIQENRLGSDEPRGLSDTPQ